MVSHMYLADVIAIEQILLHLKHLKAPSPIYDHSNTTGHNITLNNFSIVGRKEQNLSRLIKESMFIRVNNPIPEQKHRQIPSGTHMG